VRPPDRPRGFTLLEVAVALAILGAGVVTCLQVFSGALRLQDRAARQVGVVRQARSMMDSLLLEAEPLNGVRELEPTAEGYVTVLRGRPAGPEDNIQLADAEDLGLEVVPWIVEVDVRWQDATGAKTYSLKSLRLAQANTDGLRTLREP
jgi:prepilin-type N-terminal cleavage/methylation domain-containing protein